MKEKVWIKIYTKHRRSPLYTAPFPERLRHRNRNTRKQTHRLHTYILALSSSSVKNCREPSPAKEEVPYSERQQTDHSGDGCKAVHAEVNSGRGIIGGIGRCLHRHTGQHACACRRAHSDCARSHTRDRVVAVCNRRQTCRRRYTRCNSSFDTNLRGDSWRIAFGGVDRVGGELDGYGVGVCRD